MNYIGSKLSLLDFIDTSIEQITGGNYSTVCDLFAGTGVVGRHFKKKGKKIISNDIQYYSFVLNRHYIGNHQPLTFRGLEQEIVDLSGSDNKPAKVCTYLNNLNGEGGFIYQNYCLGGSKSRQYFSDKNGILCDAIRTKIEDWYTSKKIIDDEYYFLLTTLLEAIDKVANTASVYGAFLKQLKKPALKPLSLQPAELILNDQDHIVINGDANQVVAENAVDVLYLDPPYNQRQYATNYHLLETIARYDNPEIRGKTGLREYSKQKSLYCSKSKAKEAFAGLIRNAKAKYIFLSYNNEGILALDDIKEIMSSHGEYGYFTRDYRRFKADSDRSYLANATIEYLHYVKCRN